MRWKKMKNKIKPEKNLIGKMHQVGTLVGIDCQTERDSPDEMIRVAMGNDSAFYAALMRSTTGFDLGIDWLWHLWLSRCVWDWRARYTQHTRSTRLHWLYRAVSTFLAPDIAPIFLSRPRVPLHSWWTQAKLNLIMINQGSLHPALHCFIYSS